MKKVLWLIVCLMTMVVSFTSCSSDDENEISTENYSYLNGEWVGTEYSDISYIIHDGWMDVVDATGNVVAKNQFVITNNIIIVYNLNHWDFCYGEIYKMTPTEIGIFYADEKGDTRRHFSLKRK